MAEKYCFDMTELIFQIMCVTVVQWSRSCLNVQINRVRLPATLFSVSLYLFFLCWVFLTLLLLTLLVIHLDQYIFKLKCRVLFWKRNFKSSWSAYWPSLRPEKNHKLSRHVPPLKQLKFFQCQLTLWQTLTHSTPQAVSTNLHPTPTSDPLAKVKLAFCTSS